MSKWELYDFDVLMQDQTKAGRKIKKEDYLKEGKYPIIDQGQDHIAGYTNLDEGIYKDVPAIIFGDHTRIIKYVNTPFFLGADGVKLLRASRKDIDYRYLYHYFSANPVMNTGYNRHFKWLRELKIPLPPLEEQKKIAATLDTVSDLIRLRKRQLEELDLLVKARFVEMFGLPETNPHNFAKIRINDISEELFAGGDKPIDYSTARTDEYKYPVFSNGETNGGLLCYSKNYRVKQSAITISARGTIGFCVIREPYFTPVVRLVTLVPKNNVDLVYLKNAIELLKIRSTGTSQGQLTVPDFRILFVLLPPFEYQKDFSGFVEQVEESKLLVHQAQDELQTLMKTLIQQYF